MFKSKIFFCTILLSSVSCSQFQTGRSFLAQMTNDDSSFYTPREDFPIVAGDTGRDWETARERRSRTPAAENEGGSRGQYFLNDELRHLEGRLPSDEARVYEAHKKKLATTSEKIYFLKLPAYERKEYLSSRGFTSPEDTSAPELRELFGLRQSDLSAGMSKTDVVNSWGKPTRVEIAGNPSYENERWLYNLNGATKYIYFESGRVEGWE